MFTLLNALEGKWFIRGWISLSSVVYKPILEFIKTYYLRLLEILV